MDESATTQNRRTRRSHLLMTATLEISGRALTVKLRNLSSEGAQVEARDLPVEGTQLLFRKGDLAAVGNVVWVKGAHAGIRFDQPLEPEAVLHHIPVPKPRAQNDFRRPGLASRALTDGERKLVEAWSPVRPIPPVGQ